VLQLFLARQQLLLNSSTAQAYLISFGLCLHHLPLPLLHLPLQEVDMVPSLQQRRIGRLQLFLRGLKTDMRLLQIRILAPACRLIFCLQLCKLSLKII
jgi:hypothetical protein